MRCSASSSFDSAAVAGVFPSACAQFRELAEQHGQRVRRGGRFRLRKPFAKAALELRTRTLLFMLTGEARLERLARRFAARETDRVVAEMQRLPAAIELDHRREDRAGLVRQRLQVGENGIRCGDLALAIRNGIDPLPRKPGHAAVLVLGRFGELAQPFRGMHAFRGRHSRFRVLGSECKLDQRAFLADRGDRGSAARGIRRASRHLGTDRIGTGTGFEECRRASGVARFRNHGGQRGGQGKTDGGIGFALPGGGERTEIGASVRRGKADLGCGIAGEQHAEFVRIRGQFGNTKESPRRVGVLVLCGTEEAIGDHGVKCFRIDVWQAGDCGHGRS